MKSINRKGRKDSTQRSQRIQFKLLTLRSLRGFTHRSVREGGLCELCG